MFQSPISSILKQRFKTIFFLGLLVGIVSVLASLLFPLEFRADAQVLIISRSRYGVDPYTVAKSAERIGESIAQVVSTNDFYNKVIAQPQYTLDLSKFTDVNERVKRKRWDEAVDASVVYGTGVLNISAYHKVPDQARQLAGAVADTLIAHAVDYVGGDVSFKILNQPVSTAIPVRPNLLINFGAGFLLGALLAVFWVLKKRLV
jgi:capsular polysaccharide biosynthesis protein